MNGYAEDALKGVSTFGATAWITTLAYALLFGMPLTRDDSYALGLSAAMVVAPISVLTLACERRWNRHLARVVHAAAYLICAAFTVYEWVTAELHGPGIALLIFSAAVVLGALDLLVFRRIRTLYFVPAGLVLTISFIAFASVLLV